MCLKTIKGMHNFAQDRLPLLQLDIYQLTSTAPTAPIFSANVHYSIPELTRRGYQAVPSGLNPRLLANLTANSSLSICALNYHTNTQKRGELVPFPKLTASSLYQEIIKTNNLPSNTCLRSILDCVIQQSRCTRLPSQKV